MSETKQKIAKWAGQICVERFGKNQTKMADALGYTQSTLNRLLRMQTKDDDPYLELARTVASKLGYAQDAWKAVQVNGKSIEEKRVLKNAAIVFRHAETNEVWATAELRLHVVVHKPMYQNRRRLPNSVGPNCND